MPELKIGNNLTIIKISILVSLLIFIAISNVLWLRMDNTPQRWDESLHLKNAEQFRITKPRDFPDAFLSINRYYPPFVPIAGSVSARVFGSNEDGFTYIIILFQLLLITGVFLFTRRIFGFKSAIAAASIAAAYPALITEGHYFMLDVPLASVTAIYIYLILRTENFKSGVCSFLAGITAGIGMLTKWTFIIYAITPLILELQVFNREKMGDRLKNLAIFAVSSILICGAWYIENGFTAYDILKFAAYSGADLQNAPPVLSLKSLALCFQALAGSMNPIFIFLLMAAIVIMILDEKNRKYVMYVIVPLTIFFLIKNKQGRYLMPILPFAAILTSYLIYIIKNKIAGIITTTTVVVLSMAIYIVSNFNIIQNWPIKIWPSESDWKIEQMLSDVKSDSKGKTRLCVMPDFCYINNYTMGFKVLSGKYNIAVTESDKFPYFTDYVLIKDKDNGLESGRFDERKKITDLLLSGKYTGFKKMAKYPLPDGTNAFIFKRQNRFVNKEEANIVFKRMFPFIKGVNVKAVSQNQSGTDIRLVSDGCIIGNKFNKNEQIFRISKIDLNVKNAGFTMFNGNMELSTFDAVEVNELIISQNDFEKFSKNYGMKLNDNNFKIFSTFIRYRVNKIENPVIRFEKGNIVYSGIRKNKTYEYAVKPYLDINNEPRFKYTYYKINGFPLPGIIVDNRLNEYNSLFDEGVVSTDLYKINNITIKNEQIIIQQ